MKIFKREQMKVMGVLNQVYETDTGCQIIMGKEMNLWHLSISHLERYPTWEEIKQSRYDLLPRDRNFVMVLPPPGEYVNVHPNCFHLHELNESKMKREIKREIKKQIQDQELLENEEFIKGLELAAEIVDKTIKI